MPKMIAALMNQPLKNSLKKAMFLAAGLTLTASANAQTISPQTAMARYEQSLQLAGNTKSADAVLFPAAAEMDELPSGLQDPTTAEELRQLMLIGPGAAGWSELEQWAQQPAQRAVLEALVTITGSVADDSELTEGSVDYSFAAQDRRTVGKRETYAFNFLAGADEVPASWVDAGLYVALGKDNKGERRFIHGSQYHYLAVMSRVFLLLSVDLQLNIQDGQHANALYGGLRSVAFGRVLAERPTYAETFFGVSLMELGLEKMRDVAYQGRRDLSAETITVVNSWLQPNSQLIAVHRLQLPAAERLGVEQLVGEFFSGAGSSVKRGELATYLANTRSADFSLLLFEERAAAKLLADKHERYNETAVKLDEVYGDLQKRWEVDVVEGADWLSFETDLEQMNKLSFGIISETVEQFEPLFDVRERLYNDLPATEAGLGIIAFTDKRNTLPPNMNAVEPRYVRRLGRDLNNYSESRRRHGFFQYFVPVRDDSVGEFDRPKVLDLTVVMVDVEEIELEGIGDIISILDQEGELTPGQRKTMLSIVNNYVIEQRELWADTVWLDTENRRDRRYRSVKSIDADKLTDSYLSDLRKELQKDMKDAGSIFEVDGLYPMIFLYAEFAVDLVDALPGAMLVEGLREVVEELLAYEIDPGTTQDVFNRIVDWYATTDAGKAFDDEFKISFEDLKASLLLETQAAYENPALADVLQHVREGNEPTGQHAKDFFRAMVDLFWNGDFVRNGVRIAQVDARGFKRWESISTATSTIFTEEELADGLAFEYQLDNTDDVTHFTLWSVGRDGKNDRISTVGPGGADTLYWPPVLLMQRELYAQENPAQ